MRKYFSPRVFLPAFGFGLAAVVTLWGGLQVQIPGSGVVTDAREPFVLLGAALTGPVGAIPIGILAGAAAVEPDLRPHVVTNHLLGAIFVGWAYGFLISRRIRLPGYIAGWVAIVTSYYFVVSFPVFAVEALFFPRTFELTVGPVATFWEGLHRLYRGWGVEFGLTATITSAVLILLPRINRRPLWLSPEAQVPAGPLDLSTVASAARSRGALAFRLIGWFLLLALLPVMVVDIFIRDDLASLLYDHEGIHLQDLALVVAGRPTEADPPAGRSAPVDAISEAIRLHADGRIGEVPGFRMLDSSLATEIGGLISDSGSASGWVIDEGRGFVAGYVREQSRGGLLIIGARLRSLRAELIALQQAAYTRLATALFFTAVLSGLVIWLLIGRPMGLLTRSVEDLGKGRLDTRTNARGMEDEVRTLGVAFNTMAQNIEGLHRGLEEDIAERRRAAESLERLLREREMLLKEIHHRVKNNLQVICSLLSLQQGEIRDPADRALFRASENRVRAMALIHEKLYRTKDFANVNLPDYIEGLVNMLVSLYAPGRVATDISIDRIALGIDTAVPCGLLINELVTNSIVHGFPDGRSGVIRISLRRENGGKQLLLCVADNGVGIPESVIPAEGKTLGLGLVRVLAEQLGGTLELARNSGTEARVLFPAPDAQA